MQSHGLLGALLMQQRRLSRNEEQVFSRISPDLEINDPFLACMCSTP